MTSVLKASVDKLIASKFELTSDKAWRQVTKSMWIRPYFDKALVEVWLVTVTFTNNQWTLGLFKEHSSYSLVTG